MAWKAWPQPPVLIKLFSSFCEGDSFCGGEERWEGREEGDRRVCILGGNVYRTYLRYRHVKR